MSVDLLPATLVCFCGRSYLTTSAFDGGVCRNKPMPPISMWYLSRCGDPETLEHLLCTCPGLAKERSTVTTAYRRQGLPATTLEHLLFPSRPHLPALRSLADFIEETGIAAYH
ncbi:hypothetical protein HPB52_018477 [Rhipicephalus sanguineus]|uniref:Tick transposon n=1 Tax=Rhipicephalus sanguineus TaxID=34632 RepID=A0A9D4T4R5_RHISA|nr:hypothetical protein HPB52_018477 [Rhipicephalus sanguineus]